MTSQLSWQPPPVTKCGECCHKFDYSNQPEAFTVCAMMNSTQTYSQNKDGITPSCPMWQQQNKEVG